MNNEIGTQGVHRGILINLKKLGLNKNALCNKTNESCIVCDVFKLNQTFWGYRCRYEDIKRFEKKSFVKQTQTHC